MIDFDDTDHLTSNFNIFSGFWSHKTPFHMTISDWPSYNIVGYGTIKLTFSITLSSALIVSKLTFDLIFVNILTKNLNYCISFFLIIVFFIILWWSRLLVNDILHMVSTFLIYRYLNHLHDLMSSLHLKYIID